MSMICGRLYVCFWAGKSFCRPLYCEEDKSLKVPATSLQISSVSVYCQHSIPCSTGSADISRLLAVRGGMNQTFCQKQPVSLSAGLCLLCTYRHTQTD